MKRRGQAGFLRSPIPVGAIGSDELPAEAALLTDQAWKNFRTRRMVWKVNLTLVPVLVASHVALKFPLPGFAAAESLAIELGVPESATLVITRRLIKKEGQLKEQFMGEAGPGGEGPGP